MNDTKTADANADADVDEGPCCKLGRAVEKYALDGLDDDLRHSWTTDGEESASLRELERRVNRRMLETALDRADVRPLDGDAASLYRVVADAEGVSESRRLEVVRRLEREGVDVDALEGDFVSHQTVYNHLRDCLDVERDTERTPEEQLDRGVSTVRALQSRTETVTEQTVDRLRRNGLLDVGEFDVIADVQVICDECGRTHSVDSLVDAGGCECQRS